MAVSDYACHNGSVPHFDNLEKKFQLNGFTSIHYSFRKFFLDRERVSMGIKLSRGPHEHLAGAITVTIMMLDLLWYSVYL